jgi:hypothetical protein
MRDHPILPYSLALSAFAMAAPAAGPAPRSGREHYSKATTKRAKKRKYKGSKAAKKASRK